MTGLSATSPTQNAMILGPVDKRRRQHLGAQMVPIVPKSAPDPIPAKEPKDAWKVVAGIGACLLAVGLGVLAALGGASASLDSGPGRPSA